MADGMELPRREDIVIPPEEYPDWAKEKQYDGVVLYCSSDAYHAKVFKDLIEKFIVLQDGKSAKLCVIHKSTADIAYIAGEFSALEEAMKRSTFIFLYLSENFCDKEEVQAEWLRDEALMEVLHNPERRWCLIPIHSRSNLNVPFGIRALRGIAISGLLNGGDFSDISTDDVASLKKKNFDRTILSNIETTLNSKLNHRIARERKHAEKVVEWEDDEKLRRWKDLVAMLRQKKAKEEDNMRQEREYLESLERKAPAAANFKDVSMRSDDALARIKTAIDEKLRNNVSQPDIYEFIKRECKTLRSDIRESAVDYLMQKGQQQAAINTHQNVVIIQNPHNVKIDSSGRTIQENEDSESGSGSESDYVIIERQETSRIEEENLQWNPSVQDRQRKPRHERVESKRQPVQNACYSSHNSLLAQDPDVDCSEGSHSDSNSGDFTDRKTVQRTTIPVGVQVAGDEDDDDGDTNRKMVKVVEGQARLAQLNINHDSVGSTLEINSDIDPRNIDTDANQGEKTEPKVID